MGDELIRIHNISKIYGRRKVLENINLTIERGQSIAILGVNGSGKSTLLRILCGLTGATSGDMKYPEHLKFNYIPEHFPKMNITARKYLDYMGAIEKLTNKAIREKCQELARAFSMENMLDIPMKNLSKGTLQKVAVIQALMTKPDVLLLDEPLSGQDIRSQKEFISRINTMRKQGVTVIMSCHEMFLVNRISDVVYEIKNQKLEQVKLESDIEYDVLIFENKDQNSKVNPVVSEMAERLEYDQNEIRLVALRDKSNGIILQMLKDGFRISSMKGIGE